ncbi:hypothetical protein CDAR_183481, partial [Caerostris darwini]
MKKFWHTSATQMNWFVEKNKGQLGSWDYNVSSNFGNPSTKSNIAVLSNIKKDKNESSVPSPTALCSPNNDQKGRSGSCRVRYDVVNYLFFPGIGRSVYTQYINI